MRTSKWAIWGFLFLCVIVSPQSAFAAMGCAAFDVESVTAPVGSTVQVPFDVDLWVAVVPPEEWPSGSEPDGYMECGYVTNVYTTVTQDGYISDGLEVLSAVLTTVTLDFTDYEGHYYTISGYVNVAIDEDFDFIQLTWDDNVFTMVCEILVDYDGYSDPESSTPDYSDAWDNYDDMYNGAGVGEVTPYKITSVRARWLSSDPWAQNISIPAYSGGASFDVDIIPSGVYVPTTITLSGGNGHSGVGDNARFYDIVDGDGDYNLHIRDGGGIQERWGTAFSLRASNLLSTATVTFDFGGGQTTTTQIAFAPFDEVRWYHEPVFWEPMSVYAEPGQPGSTGIAWVQPRLYYRGVLLTPTGGGTRHFCHLYVKEITLEEPDGNGQYSTNTYTEGLDSYVKFVRDGEDCFIDPDGPGGEFEPEVPDIYDYLPFDDGGYLIDLTDSDVYIKNVQYGVVDVTVHKD